MVYSEPDAELPFVSEADEAYSLGGTTAAQNYLNIELLLEVLHASKADAVHPGYGFLAESSEFARAVIAAGVKFIGPSARNLELMGDKILARQRMESLGVPVLPATARIENLDECQESIDEIGYPMIIKATAGGGGIGMNVVHSPDRLPAMVERTSTLAQRVFGDGGVFLERYIPEARHIEFQIVADEFGEVRHLFDRDCTIQRRHQKIIEEAPGSGGGDCLRAIEKACSALEEIGYNNIGTVEMLRDAEGRHFFIEMNTRLQVEHAVTEVIADIDLVEMQIRLAVGESLRSVLATAPERCGHAIEARIYAEDPVTFFPSPGRLDVLHFPSKDGIRCEMSFCKGATVSQYYDPMLALVIARGENRIDAINVLDEYLAETKVEGVKSNISFLRRILNSTEFQTNTHHTGTATELISEVNDGAHAAG